MKTSLWSAVRLVVAVALVAPMGVSCGSDDDAGQGLLVSAFGPPPEQFPDLDPFLNCDLVNVCHQESGDDERRSCVMVRFEEREAAVSALAFDTPTAISMECFQEIVDPTSGARNRVPVSNGQSCGVRRAKSQKDLSTTSVYMLPDWRFGPTVSFGSAATSKPSIPGRWGAVAQPQTFDGQVFLAGGAAAKNDCAAWSTPACVTTVSDSVELFDPTTGTFTLLGGDDRKNLSVPRAFAASVVLPTGEIAVFGGLSPSGSSVEPTTSVDIWDPVFQEFAAGTPMTKARAYHSATLISNEAGGTVLLAGGIGSGSTTWEVWTRSAVVKSGEMSAARWNHSATLISPAIDPSIASAIVVLAGGDTGTETNRSISTSMDVFDVPFLTMNPNPLLLCGEGKPKTMHTAVYVPSRHFLYIGGGFKDIGHSEPVADVCVWQATQKVWAGSLSLKSARGALTGTPIVGTNFVLFAGGLTKRAGVLEAAQTVDILLEYKNEKNELVIDIGPFDYPVPMLYPRWGHSALNSCDGKTLFVGGVSGPAKASSAENRSELFNPGS